MNSNEKNSNIEMIIFDMDGTIWDTVDITYESANEVMKNHNINYEISEEIVTSSMGYSFEECAYRYMPFLEKEEREKLQTEIGIINKEKISKVGGKLYPKLEETLKKLSEKYKLAIVSNCGAGYIESFYETTRLEKYFIDFIAASAMKITKGEAIKEIMRRNNITEAVYVGDTKKDQDASAIAEVEFIYAKYGFGKDIVSNYEINNFNELIDVMEKF